MRQCLKITVVGKVQGTGYREFAQKHATTLNIEGTAQNMEDGTVLIHACGNADKLQSFIDQLYKGPTRSEIKNVIAEPFMNEKDYRGVFRIIGQE